jgi:hypothetical protein
MSQEDSIFLKILENFKKFHILLKILNIFEIFQNFQKLKNSLNISGGLIILENLGKF